MQVAHFSHVWNKPGMTAAERYQQLWRELALLYDASNAHLQAIVEAKYTLAN